MAVIERLTDKGIRAALRTVAQAGKAKTISDGGGLVLEVQPSGSGWWRLRYSFAGKENRLSVGTYPEIGLAVARQRRREAAELVANGSDPAEVRKAEKAARGLKQQTAQLLADGKPVPGTFEFVAREWIGSVHEVKVSADHAARTLTRLEQDAFPWLGRRPIGEIDAPELLTCLRRVEARGAIETAHRVKNACGQVFRYGVAIGACSRNPAQDLSDALRPVVVKHHAAIVDPKNVGCLLRDVANYQGHPVTRAALGLSALLLLRPGELRHMEWVWLDLDSAVLAVPSEVMKRKKAAKVNGSAHIVPLATQAVEILKELQPLTGHGKFVFPSLLTGERCMSENTVLAALRRMGYGNEDMTAHGFRAMARTMIAERLGVAAEVIEAQLAHSVGDSLGRAYNRTQFLEQRMAMMGVWADYLDRLREGGEVVQMPSKAA